MSEVKEVKSLLSGLLAIGGPAKESGTRFNVETLAEGCGSGLRWAAVRMQGHRPHQVCRALMFPPF